jgi:hypothetical protein
MRKATTTVPSLVAGPAQPAQQGVFGDLPLHTRHGLGIGGDEQPVLGGPVSPDVDQGALGPELRVVRRIGQVFAHEQGLLQRVGLNPIDGRALLGAADCNESSQYQPE